MESLLCERRTRECVCVAARASHRCSNGSGGQLQGPRLVSCLWASTAIKGGCQCGSWAPGGRAEEGAGRDPGSCENLWVKILVKSAEVHSSRAGCWFSSWSKLLGSSAEQTIENCIALAAWLTFVAPTFFPCSYSSLYVLTLLVSACGKTGARPLCCALKG